MSIQFSDTSTKRGLIQLIESNCGFDDGTITGDTTLFAKFAADVNNALDYIFAKIFKISGWTWQHDDDNNSTTDGYPTVTANLVSGTRVYAFTADANSNLILDIFKVLVMDASGVYREVVPIDVQSAPNTSDFTDGQTHSGTPTMYEKTGKYITFNFTPNYSQTNGIKMIISREGSYFTTSDTTKKAGFAGLFHEFLALRPSYQYAARKTLSNAQDLFNQMVLMENECLEHYGRRGKDVRRRITAANHSNK